MLNPLTGSVSDLIWKTGSGSKTTVETLVPIAPGLIDGMVLRVEDPGELQTQLGQVQLLLLPRPLQFLV